jgi:hypothetical protein
LVEYVLETFVKSKSKNPNQISQNTKTITNFFIQNIPIVNVFLTVSFFGRISRQWREYVKPITSEKCVNWSHHMSYDHIASSINSTFQCIFGYDKIIILYLPRRHEHAGNNPKVTKHNNWSQKSLYVPWHATTFVESNFYYNFLLLFFAISVEKLSHIFHKRKISTHGKIEILIDQINVRFSTEILRVCKRYLYKNKLNTYCIIISINKQ